MRCGVCLFMHQRRDSLKFTALEVKRAGNLGRMIRRRAGHGSANFEKGSLGFDAMRTPMRLSRVISLAAATAYVLALCVPCSPTPLMNRREPQALFNTIAFAGSKTVSDHHPNSAPHDSNTRSRASTRAKHHASHAKRPSHHSAEMVAAHENPDHSRPDPRRLEPSEEPTSMVAPCLCGCDQPASAMAEVRSPGQLIPGATVEQIARPPRELTPTYRAIMIEGIVVGIEHVPIPA